MPRTGLDPDGPAVVAVGGGHGLATTLRAARCYAGRLSAVVSVADDGGSTGRLRAASPRPAPGDLRKCLVALAGSDQPIVAAMEHRFGSGELDGHAFGNLLIAALEESEGSLVAALDEAGRLLDCVGRVLPTTTVPIELRARVDSGGVVRGQVAVGERADLRTVTVEPADAPACELAVQAVLEADQVVLGPGSLYTSVLAATAVRGIAESIRRTSAQVVYVCNLHPQVSETAGYRVDDHVAALARHGLVPDVVLYDPSTIDGADDVAGARPVTIARTSGLAHDPALLGMALADVLAASA
ncbi:gluconeogenesis factor YvcK family protein [Dermatobacter hominis]|uniref:gluconeogenesis factor YvcK family protein n=1 Tax=Dermatobacter hominis TaxID=2884263 RepID=UPI001D0FDB08|nr:uridine diphosphate-N-acetylglucosamine-binding protein YvcK [Dermatobacter hominis]UDY36747.1 uridine diphosphate-N-acetylglucosamine-binding protein YvcK [Dermatobacter hominis]